MPPRTRWPTRDTVIAMDPEDLALTILREIEAGRPNEANLQNLQLRLLPDWVNKPAYQTVFTLAELQGLDPDATEALAEAWNVMLQRGYVRPGSRQPEFVEITRAGRDALQSPAQPTIAPEIAALARLLHPRLASVRRALRQGDLVPAIVTAFTQVEVAVRERSGLSASLMGVTLMTEAFKPGGPLADAALPVAEQEATMMLFRGAFGVFRNPAAHGNARSTDPMAAAETVLLADLLLRLVDPV